MADHEIYGIHAVTAALRNPHRTVKILCVNQDRSDNRLQSLFELAEIKGVRIEKLSAPLFNRRFSEGSHQGVVAYAAKLPEYSETHLAQLLESSNSPALILILDGITDPHNLGACLRTA